ncbi:MAG: sulfatase-like hydrolase/transferase [Planctomycetaceae bacterium]|nr:sulfatase-like hydrolase/transferase [Planctomycetaceae bacterium]
MKTKHSMSVVWTVAAMSWTAAMVAGAEVQRPNIVFILSDDHSAPFVGCYGCTDVRTPNLDRFAAEGMRSDRYKFIYNCTPWIPYAPVDSAGGPGWQQMKQAAADGTLAEPLRQTYFTTPRPVYELYDLEADPSELENLSGRPAVADVERQLRLALIEKMILDFDYLPLPAIPGETAGKPARKAQRAGKK